MTPRQTIEEIRAKLRERTATSADHRPVLEAIAQLPDDEAASLINEFRTAFTAVYAREREQRQTTAGRPTTGYRSFLLGPDPLTDCQEAGQ